MTEALLLVMMDPPPDGDAEFNDWANLEHIPERKRVPGFQTALRFQNNSGSPRYLAIYDLDDISVLQSSPYRAISGENLSPWSKRILAGASARSRFEGSRIGAAGNRRPTGAKGPIAELLLVLWRNVRDRSDDAVLRSLETVVAGSPSVVQARGFVGKRGDVCDYVGIVECTEPFGASLTERSRYDLANQACDFAQVFAPLLFSAG